MNHDLPVHIQSVVDSVCELGCDRVSDIIQSLERGNAVSEIVGLDSVEQHSVLIELKAIMSVYDRDKT